MARPRTFQPDEALDAAMMVFWQKGFAETSYDDLVSATKVSRKGLYTVFGDKEALFLAAMKHYCKKMMAEMLGFLRLDNLTVGNLIQMFQMLGDKVASGQMSRGCFMANTTADEIFAKPKVKAAYDQYMNEMFEDLEVAFKRAGIAPEEATRLAIYYSGVIQSLQLMARSRADDAIVKSFVDTSLNELRKFAV